MSGKIPLVGALPTDQIRLDTSKAPWMDIALQELDKGVKELAAEDGLVDELRRQLGLRSQLETLDEQLADLEEQSVLLRKPAPAGLRLPPNSLVKPLRDPTPGILGNMEATTLKKRNPDVVKYFENVKTDPQYDPKGRSWDIDSTYESDGQGKITAWCAAFVNWCLSEAGVEHLGYATAKSWLGFGTPVAHPVYGCLTIVKPSTSTGSTTGHIAFFCQEMGTSVELLGGNQSRRVSRTRFAASSIMGYRWPTRFNHYLLADPPRSVIA